MHNEEAYPVYTLTFPIGRFSSIHLVGFSKGDTCWGHCKYISPHMYPRFYCLIDAVIAEEYYEFD